MTADEAAVVFKRNPGAPVCASKGIMLAKPGMEESKANRIALKLAEDCESYGKPRPTQITLDTRVTTPDPAVLGKTSDITARPRTCTGCANFIDPRVVSDERGWSWGLCAATGKLLDSSVYRSEAATCTMGVTGEPRDTTLGLYDLPIYSGNFGASVKVATGAFTSDPAKASQDPVDYETDAPVSAEDAAAGIRAWRRMISPDGSRFVDLPIFKIDYFPPDEQAKIPRTGDDNHPEWYIDHQGLAYDLAALWMGMDDTPCLIGHAGVGKTELASYMAWLLCLPFDRISITRTSEVDDLLGKMMFSPEKGTYFQHGRIPTRWGRPGILLLDEPNVGPDEVWQAIRPLTDNSKQLVLDQSAGERVTRDPFCFFMLAQNPEWDPMYVGTNSLNEADGSRLAPIEVVLPPEEIEREIIRRKCQENTPAYEIPDETLDTIMKIAVDIRALISEGSLPIAWGVRNQIKVGKNTQWFDLVKSYRRTIVDRLEEEAGNSIIRIVQGYLV